MVKKILVKNRKIRVLVYSVFYGIIGLLGLFVFLENVFLFNDFVETSVGISLMIISTGILFYLGYDFLENKFALWKTLCKIFGIILIANLGIVNTVIIMLAEASEQGFYFIFENMECIILWGIIFSANIYGLVARRVHRHIVINYYSENQKFLVHVLLPFVCFVIGLIFMLLCFFGIYIMYVVLVFVDNKINREKLLTISYKNKKQPYKNENIYTPIEKTPNKLL